MNVVNITKIQVHLLTKASQEADKRDKEVKGSYEWFAKQGAVIALTEAVNELEEKFEQQLKPTE